MKPRRASLLLAASMAAVMAASPTARGAFPDVWDAAATPRLARDAKALREAQRVYLEARDLGTHSDGGRDLLLVVRMILEKDDAASSPDPRLPFLYGRVLVDMGDDARAAKVLRAALARAPSHPDASDAWFTLAIACARLGDPKSEIAAYDAQLATETDPMTRAVTLSNQAEAFVIIGDLDGAIARYRRSLELAPDNALARWGLAVALDRSGDAYGAQLEARTALGFDPDARRLTSSDVFFVPDYDKYWYLALACAARASSTAEPPTQVLWWERAALSWKQYIDNASPSDPWVAIARRRSDACARELRAARVRAARSRPLRH